MTRVRVALVSLGFALALLASLAVAAGQSTAHAQTGERCFAETGYCISGEIRTFWERNGGLAVFGLPLAPQQEYVGEDGRARQAQWFERHRLELHPENRAPYNVLLGRLGVDRLEQQGRNWRAFPPLDPNNTDAERCRFFRETNHQVCDEFLNAFRSYGLSFDGRPGISYEESLALFGLPISEALTETVEGREYTVQWFERARFELHPENQPPFNVLFGRLGAEIQGSGASAALQGRVWQLEAFGASNALETAAGGQAATLAFEAERVSGNSGCNGFGGAYQANTETISFGPLISTLIACSDEKLTRQEQTIFAVLQNQVNYSLSEGQLRITNGGQTLVYRPAPANAVTGTVTYLPRIALPPQAVIEVQLVDVSRADAPAQVISSQTITANGRQVPFAFELPYDPAQIEERYTYAVQARITIDGQLRFISTQRYSVLTRGNPSSNIEVIVQPV
jgi:uncharacterized lipoprotein YbaY